MVLSHESSCRGGHVAYLVNQYPLVSHAFIRREITAVEALGWQVLRVSLRGWDAPLVDAQDLAERQRTYFLLRGGLLPLVRALARQVWRRPAGLLRGLKLALRMWRGSDKSLPHHLAYLLEACAVLEHMLRHGALHVHAHFAANPAEVAMLTAALDRRISYSFTAHGSDIMDRPQQMGLEHTVAQARFVVAVCDFGRNQICRWVPEALWRRVVVVRCGLEPGYGADAPALQVQAASQVRLLCVGRLSKEKGQLVALLAMRRMAQQGLPLPRLILAGDGPLRAALEALVAEYGLGAYVEFLGWLSSEQVRHEMRHCTALVVPSLSEGLPVVIMEAMAHGRPVVAPYLAGIPELVLDGQTGWLYPASNEEALARAMQACLQATVHQLLAMGEAARRRVWALHDMSKNAADLVARFAAQPDAPPE